MVSIYGKKFSEEDKEITKICGNFMIVTMAEQYTFCGHNEISHCKISFNFTIYYMIKMIHSL